MLKKLKLTGIAATTLGPPQNGEGKKVIKENYTKNSI
jgi:hypothetical protein